MTDTTDVTTPGMNTDADPSIFRRLARRSDSRIVLVVLLVISAILLLRCVGFMTNSSDVGITFINGTASPVDVTLSDGTAFALKPNESQVIISSSRTLPNRAEARDSSGDLVFQTALTAGMLETMGYRVTIGTAPSR